MSFEYNTTSLVSTAHGQTVHRDYLAHALRWSWAMRHVKALMRSPVPVSLIDVGCGVEAPLARVIATFPHVSGNWSADFIDVGPIKPTTRPKWATFHQNTDVMTWPGGPANLVTCFEVIEHMPRDGGVELLRSLRRFVRDDGTVLLSTPVTDGKHFPRNHIYEWGADELATAITAANFRVVSRFGTFMNIPDVKKAAYDVFQIGRFEELARYYDSEVIACLIAPLFPDQSRNNAWELQPI